MTGLKEALDYFAQSACTRQELEQVQIIRTALAEQEAEIAQLQKCCARLTFAYTLTHSPPSTTEAALNEAVGLLRRDFWSSWPRRKDVSDFLAQRPPRGDTT
ncbi:MAG: hypothetical protein WKF61_00605 [Luteimonas sp.]